MPRQPPPPRSTAWAPSASPTRNLGELIESADKALDVFDLRVTAQRALPPAFPPPPPAQRDDPHGHGPVATLTDPAAKVFAIAYTLYSAIAFLTVAAVLFGPVVTRLMHRLHLDLADDDSSGAPRD